MFAFIIRLRFLFPELAHGDDLFAGLLAEVAEHLAEETVIDDRDDGQERKACRKDDGFDRADVRADYKQIDGDAWVNGYIAQGA